MIAQKAPGFNQGFTLIEVLVALFIIAMAMGAILRGGSVLLSGQERLNKKYAANVSAYNTAQKIRLAQDFLPPNTEQTVECSQADFKFICQIQFNNTPNPSFRRVKISVHLEEDLSDELSNLEFILARSMPL